MVSNRRVSKKMVGKKMIGKREGEVRGEVRGERVRVGKSRVAMKNVKKYCRNVVLLPDFIVNLCSNRNCMAVIVIAWQ